MISQVIVTCANGTKAAILSVEDPCPNGQKMVTKTIELIETSDLSIASLTTAEAAQIWGVAFTTVMFCWLFSKSVGAVINMMR